MKDTFDSDYTLLRPGKGAKFISLDGLKILKSRKILPSKLSTSMITVQQQLRG